MSFTIFRINTSVTPNNEYKINRDEEWSMKNVIEFDTESEAKAYVIEQSLLHTELSRFSYNLKDDERKEFIDQFCFTDPKYIKYRKFYINIVPFKEIQKALESDGIIFKKIHNIF